jgi:hypothetical protein
LSCCYKGLLSGGLGVGEPGHCLESMNTA